MDPILSFTEAFMLLNSGAIICTEENGTYTYFVKKENRIFVKAEGYSCRITAEEWKELYQNKLFFRYEDQEVLVDPEKDKEYYSWRHK